MYLTKPKKQGLEGIWESITSAVSSIVPGGASYTRLKELETQAKALEAVRRTNEIAQRVWAETMAKINAIKAQSKEGASSGGAPPIAAKPNWIVLGAIGVGAYLLVMKLGKK